MPYPDTLSAARKALRLTGLDEDATIKVAEMTITELDHLPKHYPN